MFAGRLIALQKLVFLEIIIQSSRASLPLLLRLYHPPTHTNGRLLLPPPCLPQTSSFPGRDATTSNLASMPAHGTPNRSLTCLHHCDNQAENSKKKSHVGSGKLEKLSSKRSQDNSSGPLQKKSLPSSLPLLFVFKSSGRCPSGIASQWPLFFLVFFFVCFHTEANLTYER